MKDTQAADIPHYYLYGDNGADVELDLLHVEPIRNRSGPHDWRIRPHSHPDHVQVLLVAKGGGAIRMEDRLLSIVPPAIVVIPAGIVHQIEFQRGTDGMVVTAALGCLKSVVRANPDLSAAIRPAVFALDGTGLDRQGVTETFDRLHHEFIWSSPGRRAMLQALYTCILVAVLRLSITREDAGIAPADRDYDLVVRYRALLELHFRQERKLDFYAGELAITPARLNAACKARAGRTASSLLHERILVEAKRYLLFTESTIAQVAHLTGFPDPAYFNRFFTQRTGQSPGAFRRSALRGG
ncbi:helix-turn-helix domain-containing protein [uncultured Salipiger sp.]|uniref:helix-turn-helix domain-containing protein n=1 Tax=uncultured Salipiger sp. TaxID=499810 RepID=UPI00259485C2|nr:helix-turn-helix domain-containing protein [uncultured Salipiger sp.]